LQNNWLRYTPQSVQQAHAPDAAPLRFAARVMRSR
jgi:hypothetical protein